MVTGKQKNSLNLCSWKYFFMKFPQFISIRLWNILMICSICFKNLFLWTLKLNFCIFYFKISAIFSRVTSKKKSINWSKMVWYFESYSNLIASSHNELIFAWEILKVLFGSGRVKTSLILCVVRPWNTQRLFKYYRALNAVKWRFLCHRKDAANKTLFSKT